MIELLLFRITIHELRITIDRFRSPSAVCRPPYAKCFYYHYHYHYHFFNFTLIPSSSFTAARSVFRRT